MHKNFLLDGSPFKFTYCCREVVGYDNLQKSFVRRLCNAHAVSYFACGVIDTVCILYFFCIVKPFRLVNGNLNFRICSKMSFCMQCQWHRMHIKNFDLLREFICIKGFSPLIGALDGCFNEKNIRGPKISWHCPFKRLEVQI
jgi:hypothetical protein